MLRTASADWSEPAREFPMFAQEAGLVAYSRAWSMYGDATYRQAADRTYGFLKNLQPIKDILADPASFNENLFRVIDLTQ